ncbi:hypothetical protein [Hydrogenivirga sp. 128-5-R1-1]|uniref:hypothetical protein n=1 Tax=Hydrogenivirga sp. 128-5-R1-1 TaxID=392423 RepID=UPI0012F70C9B|nr:hypothetical protein [Hydrogenivirga sp. 128-5-R1-1]
MWREALLLWKLSLKASPPLTGTVIALLTLLNLLTFLPPFSMMAFLLNYYILFSFVVFVSKKFIEGEGSLSYVERSMRENSTRALFTYFYETVAVLVGQIILSVGAVIFALVVLSVGGVWSVIRPLLEGGEVSWTGLLISTLLAVFVYLSVVTSFPIFFGRAMLRGRGFSGTLKSFVTSLYAEISWKTILNWDYLRSSAVISLITFGFFLAHLLVVIITPLLVFGPVLTFLTVHLLYTFGTVAAFKLLRS